MKKIILAACVLFTSQMLFAQGQDPNSPGFDMMGSDSTQGDSMGSENAEGEEGAAAVIAKPYERIVLNFDSLTNLITYSGIVEQEESTSDSLYLRTKKWADKKFGGTASGDKKGLYEIDKKNQKLVINGFLIAYNYSNKYTKRPIGKYQFKLTMLYKEGRYKYTISNIVHEGEKPNQGAPVRNYFEYYYTTTTNVKGSDQILRFADRDVLVMIEELKKSLKDPVVVDEDEW